MIEVVILMVVSYLTGSVAFGKIIAHYGYNVDIQKRGSGNIGFANVRRVRAGLLTLAGDILKGAVPTFVAYQLVNPAAAFWVGLAAIIGHVFPIWLNFKGGKGIATGLGVVAVLSPFVALCGAVTYVVGLLISHKSSSSSLAGLFVTASVGIALQPQLWWQFGILVGVALWTLRKNIAGTVPHYDI